MFLSKGKSADMYEIVLKNNLDDEGKKLIEKIQDYHKGKVYGTYEIYDCLYVSGKCRSYSKKRILYAAYTLAENNIDFIIKEI